MKRSSREISAILVRDTARYSVAHPQFADLFIDDFELVLADRMIDVIYIATPIALHAEFALSALDAGKHVWSEKPLTQSAERTASLVAAAEKNDRMLSEVDMYLHHRQFRQLRSLLADKVSQGEAINWMAASFSIPSLPAGNIRYDPLMGGGALLDLGFYPISTALELFGEPLSIAATGSISKEFGVDLSGSALLTYPGFGFHAFWALGATYSSTIELNLTRSRYLFERAFAKPHDLETEILTHLPSGMCDPIFVQSDDHFSIMFDHFENTLRGGDRIAWARMRAAASLRAKTLQRIYDAIYSVNA